MKKLIALMLVFYFFFGCASTVINTKPSGAEIYAGDKVVGKTPHRFSSGAISGTKYDFILKKEGYNDQPVQIKKNHADVGMILAGLFLFWPLLLWWGDFPDAYEFPMEKLEGKPAEISASTPVAPSSDAVKIVTVTWTVVNIREGYSDAYPVVATVVKGDKLTVIGEYRDWFNVRLEGGKQGWVNSRVVK